MGGFGSGRTYHNKKTVVEDCGQVLSLPLMLRNCQLTRHRSVQYLAGYTIDVIPEGKVLTMRVREIGQVICLESMPLHFGGIRWWFLCPGCSRRCAFLYLPWWKQSFKCRLCHDLTYEGCQKSHVYDSFYGLLAAEMSKSQGESYTASDVARIISHAKRSHRPRWVRKRDRKPIRAPLSLSDTFLMLRLFGNR
jgi:hypothetical protein